MKKILFLGFNRDYISPYADIILNILGSIMDISFYGPGYSSQKELDLGIDQWIVNQEQYDFIMIDCVVATWSNDLQGIDVEKMFSNANLKFDTNIFLKFVNQFYTFFNKSSQKKIILANWDGYNLKKYIADFVTKTNSLVIDFQGTMIDSVESINKKYPFKKLNLNDNWFNFIKQNKERIITVPHTIYSSEFDLSPLENRKHNFTVVGSGYFERKKALKMTTLSFRTQSFISKLRLYINMQFSIKMTSARLNNYQFHYYDIISNSKSSFCSGGPMLYGVRKYFEIPSRGTVAIGWDCSGFNDMGFMDGVNFLKVKNNIEIKDILESYSVEELQKIANEGRMLIWRNHSDWARKKQLLETFNLISEGKFNGSYWEKGTYKHY
jgi:hypothetical protein